jgi:hypothetical protein
MGKLRPREGKKLSQCSTRIREGNQELFRALGSFLHLHVSISYLLALSIHVPASLDVGSEGSRSGTGSGWNQGDSSQRSSLGFLCEGNPDGQALLFKL